MFLTVGTHSEISTISCLWNSSGPALLHWRYHLHMVLCMFYILWYLHGNSVRPQVHCLGRDFTSQVLKQREFWILRKGYVTSQNVRSITGVILFIDFRHCWFTFCVLAQMSFYLGMVWINWLYYRVCDIRRTHQTCPAICSGRTNVRQE